MARIIHSIDVDLTVARAQVSAAADSFRSVKAALSAMDAAQRLDCCGPYRGMLFDDAGDLIVGKTIDAAAAFAGKLDVVQIKPSDRYVEFVSAVAAHGHEYAIGVRHGWPILSLGCCSTSVADGEGAGNALPGGLAA